MIITVLPNISGIPPPTVMIPSIKPVAVVLWSDGNQVADTAEHPIVTIGPVIPIHACPKFANLDDMHTSFQMWHSGSNTE